MSIDGTYGAARGLTNLSTLVVKDEMPSVCEGCLGDPYVRMSRYPHGSVACKFCSQPYTAFSWRLQGRNTKTEICSACAQSKNLCRVCIKDLKFGLPSQLRDAVLSSSDDVIQTTQSLVNQLWHLNSEVASFGSGGGGVRNDERLIAIAKCAHINRGNSRLSSLSASCSGKTPIPYEQEEGNVQDLNAEAISVVGSSSEMTKTSSTPFRPFVTIPTSTAKKIELVDIGNEGKEKKNEEKLNKKRKKIDLNFVPALPPGPPPLFALLGKSVKPTVKKSDAKVE